MFDTYTSLEDASHSQSRATALLACRDNLMPLSWHMPISKSPFLYAVAVREENYTHELLSKYKSFTLNFVPFSLYQTVDILGRVHGNNEDKLRLSSLAVEGRDIYQNALLSDSDFIYQCEVCDTYKNGDHTIFIADVTKIYINQNQSNEPMIFAGKGRYMTTCKEIRATEQML